MARMTEEQQPDRLSYEQYAAKHGLVTDYDVQGHIHGGLMAAHMPKSYHRRFQKRLIELQEARAEGKRRYAAAIAAGEVEPHPAASLFDSLVSRAAGDPDMPSTQAAKRILEKRQAAIAKATGRALLKEADHGE